MTTIVASATGGASSGAAPVRSNDAASKPEDTWDFSHHRAFVGGMQQEAHMEGMRRSHGSSGVPIRQPDSLVGLIVMYTAHALAQRAGVLIVDGIQWSLMAGCRRVRDGYRMAFPLAPADLLRQALFSRRQVDGFMREAIMDNKKHIVMQPHRLCPKVRAGLEADGFLVKEASMDGVPSIEVHFTPLDPDKARRSRGWFGLRS